VENLRFKEEADFPGFLKYDFPFSSSPKAQWVQENNVKFASYELQKFLVFPMKNGTLHIPAVGCELRVRPPSGAYTAADLILNVDRASNSLSLNVLSPPPADLVGQFILRNEIVLDEPRSKVMRLSLEGYGQVTTFDFSPPASKTFSARLVNSSTSSKIEGERLRSKKTADYEILPVGSTISVAVNQTTVRQFDPAAERVSELRLPVLRLRFAPPGVPVLRPVPLPKLGDLRVFWVLFLFSFSVLLLPFAFFAHSGPRPRPPKLARLFHKTNPSLQISKAAAQKLYRQMALEITAKDARALPILEILKRHVPESEWMPAARAMRRLEAIAFSPSRENAITYREMKSVCQKLERLWQF
jgi:hypothetical protein